MGRSTPRGSGAAGGGGLLSELLDSASRLAPSDVLDGAVATVLVQLQATRAAVWTVDQRAEALTLAACAGTPVEPELEAVAFGQTLVGRVAQRRSPLHEAAPHHDPGAPSASAYPLAVGGRIVGVLGVWRHGWMDDSASALLARVAEVTATAAERREVELRTTSVLATLNDIGRSLVAELDLDRLLQQVTDSAVRLTDAGAAAFFYNAVDDRGESYLLYTLSGAPGDVFEQLGMPRNTAIFQPTFAGEGTVRYDDVTAQAAYGQMAPHHGMPEGHPPVRSYLAVPVVGRDEQVIGGLFLGHPEPGRFTETDERLAEGLAGYTAIAVENARRFQAEQQIALTLQRSLLPHVDSGELPAEVAVRYLPSAAQAEVGGDWYDVASLADGSLAVTVGDVEGHNIQAAARMGAVRTAVSVYARSEADPAKVLAEVDAYLGTIRPQAMVTAVHATFDPDSGRLRLAAGGHPPPLVVRADGRAALLDHGRGPVLGFGLYEAVGPAAEETLEPGACLVLFTDGLVERPGTAIDESIESLRAAVDGVGFDSAEALADHVLAAAIGDHPARDDVALVVLRAPRR